MKTTLVLSALCTAVLAFDLAHMGFENVPGVGGSNMLRPRGTDWSKWKKTCVNNNDECKGNCAMVPCVGEFNAGEIQNVRPFCECQFAGKTVVDACRRGDFPRGQSWCVFKEDCNPISDPDIKNNGNG
ncbi:unnamed protein product [Zymoseptoria tritici ST99CH_1E4]|uniref:Uncharacterized protein n=1 Tax=Zymoseptoria tritici ST99CH_1E4 TaxID=1276532 RepID=A0A2H1GQL8_ZYMTR|nr:unnamed protein product [Zymoseptoria tritici ST99CH_1E4]